MGQRQLRMKLSLLAVAGLGLTLVGCSGEDKGEAPPPQKPMTQAEIDAMPPEARKAMESAMKQGNQVQQSRGVTPQ